MHSGLLLYKFLFCYAEVSHRFLMKLQLLQTAGTPLIKHTVLEWVIIFDCKCVQPNPSYIHPMVEYPTHCTGYYGPHSLECLKTIWTMVGCDARGTGYPPKLSPTELDRITMLNLR